MNPTNKKILFIVNCEKPEADKLSARLSKAAGSAGFASDIVKNYPLDENVFKAADLCCAIGGDGTILACVKGAAKYETPVLGINLGKLGFMTSLTDTVSDGEFVDIIKGEHILEKRTLISAKFANSEVLAMNEFVVRSKMAEEVSSIEVWADGEFVSGFLGDGIIFSTPTGSTAYNLSAGGPLLHPSANVFVLTSICPHTLSNRSIVFDASTKIEVRTKGSILIADGKQLKEWSSDNGLTISLAKKTLNFLRLKNHSHFGILRNKLGWSGNTGGLKK